MKFDDVAECDPKQAVIGGELQAGGHFQVLQQQMKINAQQRFLPNISTNASKQHVIQKGLG